jgi:hypothetical protein
MPNHIKGPFQVAGTDVTVELESITINNYNSFIIIIQFISTLGVIGFGRAKVR